jgi:hypothetical protein
LATSRTNEYGRVDKTAAKFLLAQIYLNAKVYIGVDRFNEAATLSNEITSSGYTFANVAYKICFQLTIIEMDHKVNLFFNRK